VTGLLRRLSLRPRHARPEMLSRYLDDEVTPSERLALEAHLLGCDGCRALLESLKSTLAALRSMHANARPGLADSVIGALEARSFSPSGTPRLTSPGPRSPTLSVVPNRGGETIGAAIVSHDARSERRRVMRVLLRYSLRRPQLRLTLPLGLSVGIALSLINKGYMIFDGRVDAEMCAVCGLDFVIPFIALNVGLLVATRVTRRRGL
jgi:hypothetical protein